MKPRTPFRGRWSSLKIGLGILLFIAVAALPTPPQALAQIAESSKEASIAAPQLGPWDRTVAYVRVKQREIQRELADAIKALRQERSLAAAWSLIALSFFYGVFHALGPGHGKAVISTYLLTQRSDLRKGLALSWGGSLLQGVTAIALVYGAVALVDWTQRDARDWWNRHADQVMRELRSYRPRRDRTHAAFPVGARAGLAPAGQRWGLDERGRCLRPQSRAKRGTVARRLGPAWGDLGHRLHWHSPL